MVLESHKNVFIFTPILLLGGTEIQTLNLIRVLINLGYTVTVCCYFEFDESVVSQYRNAGVKLILLKLNRSISFIGNLFKLFIVFIRLVAILNKYKPNIVHVQYLAPGFIPIFFHRK